VQVKALACELPATLGAPLSRFSVADVAQQARQFGLVASTSNSAVWRWLHADAIRPWQHRCWIFARDPQIALRARRILDLYEGAGRDKRCGPMSSVHALVYESFGGRSATTDCGAKR